MDNQAVDAVILGGSAGSHLTVWGLFLEADVVVKVVLLVLLLASFWSWTIIFEKAVRMRRLRSRAGHFEEAFWSGGSLEELFQRVDARPPDPMSAVFVSAMREWRRSTAKGRPGTGEANRVTLAQRIERVMDITVGREMERLERQMIFLASVGSAAPFIGLFGTVWGIMNAFTSIAASKNTSLAVVAPGIAEALFATALGLVAAIPAVIGFNKLSNDLGRYAARLEAFAGEFGAILSRQMEEPR
jgi:biopolymer transport protein TolQ